MGKQRFHPWVRLLPNFQSGSVRCQGGSNVDHGRAWSPMGVPMIRSDSWFLIVLCISILSLMCSTRGIDW
jgi:hypothetical protein